MDLENSTAVTQFFFPWYLIENDTNESSVWGARAGDPLWRDIPVGVVLTLLSLLTFIGNAMVLHAVRTERRLQTVSKQPRLNHTSPPDHVETLKFCEHFITDMIIIFIKNGFLGGYFFFLYSLTILNKIFCKNIRKGKEFTINYGLWTPSPDSMIYKYIFNQNSPWPLNVALYIYNTLNVWYINHIQSSLLWERMVYQCIF